MVGFLKSVLRDQAIFLERSGGVWDFLRGFVFDISMLQGRGCLKRRYFTLRNYMDAAVSATK